MKSLLLTLFSTKRGLKILDEEFEDDLYRKSLLIFGVYGMIQFITDFEQEAYENGILQIFLEFGLSILFSIIVGLIFSYMLYQVGKWFNGNSNFIEIFSLLAYSYFPIIIGLIIIIIFKETNYEIGGIKNTSLFNFILLLSWLLSGKIIFQGLLKFNDYGIVKAILNLSILIGLIVGLYFLLPYLIIS